jgi:hypothetical protein
LDECARAGRDNWPAFAGGVFRSGVVLLGNAGYQLGVAMIESGITVVVGALNNSALPLIIATAGAVATLFALGRDRLALPLAILSAGATYQLVNDTQARGLSAATLAVVALLAIGGIYLWRMRVR